MTTTDDDWAPRAATWDEIETGFHEYAADLTKQELEWDGGQTSFPPEFADWKVGMAAARKWLAAHDARVRRDAQREAYTTARSALAGEDTVEWARGAHSSSMSYPHAIGIMDDLIEDLDEEVSP